MSAVTNPDASIALHVLDVVEARLQRAMAQAATGKSVATVSDDPTTFVIADRLGSDAQAFAAVKSSLGAAAVPTLVANAAVSSISDTLLKLKQSVIEAQSGVVSGSAADSQIQSLLSQISGSVAEATVNGVNLVAGAVAGDVQRTQIAIPRNLDGATITIGDAGLSAMNATVAGLGLDGFTATSGGLAVGFSSLVADNIGTAAPASQMQVTTANYGAAETPQYPGQSWTFVFTDAAGPASSPADSNVVVDASGNVTHVDHTIPVPLPTGFTLAEATDALQRALHDARFETSYATTGPSPTLAIAGNNIGSAAVQNLRPALPIAVRPGSALLTAGVTAGASSFPIKSVVLADIPSSLAGATFLSTQSQINAYKSSNPNRAGLLPGAAGHGDRAGHDHPVGQCGNAARASGHLRPDAVAARSLRHPCVHDARAAAAGADRAGRGDRALVRAGWRDRDHQLSPAQDFRHRRDARPGAQLAANGAGSCRRVDRPAEWQRRHADGRRPGKSQRLDPGAADSKATGDAVARHGQSVSQFPPATI